MNIETASTFSKSVLSDVAAIPLNKEAQDAYSSICSQAGSLTISDPNRAYDKFVHIWKSLEPEAIPEPNVIEAFYTPVCSVKLVCRNLFYFIVLTVTDGHLKAGSSDKSNRILRIAFTNTSSNDRRNLESKLEIRIDNNIEAIYQDQFDKRMHRENIKYLQKKGIKV